MNDQQLTEYLKATLATLDAIWGASPLPWAPPGGLSQETTSSEEEKPGEQHAA